MTDLLSEVPEDVRPDASAWIEWVTEAPYVPGDEQPAWSGFDEDDDRERS